MFPIITSYKRLAAVSGAILGLVIAGLAFITHSTCACGDKIDKSLLRIIVEDIIKAVFG